MRPSESYQKDVLQKVISEDAAQREILSYLDTLYCQLCPTHPHTKNWGSRLKTFFGLEVSKLEQTMGALAATPEIKGIYLWGGVGRGKTYLMDLLYKSLSAPKLRQHFYAFMADIHVELKLSQGQADPLKQVARRLAQKVKIICLDEFFVEDIADAMILSGLLHYLFEFKVMLITTSNVAPSNLYLDGLQRDRFLPAINLINTHMQVLHLDTPQDYRLTKSLCDHRYHFPLDDSPLFMEAQFNHLNHGQALLPNTFNLNKRALHAVKRSKSAICFEFMELCATARSSEDYLKLSQAYPAILISNIPELNENLEEATRRFITLVDTTYDQGVLLVLAAAVPLEKLYTGKLLNFEFERVKSRIIEMQSWKVD